MKRAPLRTLILFFATAVAAGVLRSLALMGLLVILWGAYFIFRLAQAVRQKVEARKQTQRSDEQTQLISK
ncbi:MAG TPA: hypothetical protein VG537_04860 [Candidatus Kapabacteria bacterium]|nr:hypothetical protein [Candidatus Kapabacteria bacterium]